ncbi:unnamed protein product [Choristocarpus tenellus]
MLLALVAKLNCVLIYSDEKKAFAQAELEETLYVELPEVQVKFDGAVGLLLTKCVWDSTGVSELEFSAGGSFVGTGIGKIGCRSIFVQIYDHDFHVYDMVMAEEPGVDYAVGVIEGFNKKFPMVNLGEVTKFMGCRIRRNRKPGTLVVDQILYIGELSERYGIGMTYELPSITKSGAGGACCR